MNKAAYNAYQARIREEARSYLKNASPRQKELWALEKKYAGNPKHREKYREITEELATYLPPRKQL